MQADEADDRTLSDFLDAELRQRGWSVRQLAVAAGLDHTTVGKRPRGAVPTPALETLVGLSRALGVSLVVLLKLAYPDLPGIEPSADALLLADRVQRLTPDQRAVVDALICGLLFP